MKKNIPSFQLQILILFILLLIFSVIFTRTYFLNSLEEYLTATDDKQLEESLMRTYKDYRSYLPDSLESAFGEEVVNSIKIVKNNRLQKDFFREEIDIYSIYFAVFMVLFGLLIFVVSFAVIARPLKRLEAANVELGKGRFDVRVKENQWSPLNELLVSFNKMASEIEENRRLLLEAEKKMIWREIARAMAHEIKNPLTPIKLSIERLEMKYYQEADNFDDVFENTTKIINEEVDNLQKLVNRFRGFAALPSPEPENYDIVNQVQDLVVPYKEERSIDFVCNMEELKILADKLQIKQVLTNLIQNAIHATKSDEKIEIEIEKKDRYCQIEIKDSGQGIESASLNKIFEPYFTTKRKGTGLGLALVKQIVENHGGFISVTSEVGQGTVVQVNLLM